MLLALAFLVASGWEAGASRKVITPQQAMWMAGYAGRTAPASGTESDLFARAFAMKDGGGNRAVVVALDEFQAVEGFNGGSVEHALRGAAQHQRQRALH